MTPFTSERNHTQDYWWLPRAALYFPSVRKNELPSNMPRRSESFSVDLYRGISIHPVLLKVSFCLFMAMRIVIHRCIRVAELLNMIFFFCAEETMLMMGKSKRKVMEAQERPGLEAQTNKMTETTVDQSPQQITMSTPGEVIKPDQSESDREVMLVDWLECESDGEQDETNCSEKHDDMKELRKDDDWETEWSEEDDSDWSDDEQDSETSTESAALWESFFNNSDPYNLLHFSCPSGVKAKVSVAQENQTPSKFTAGGGEKPVSGEEHRNKCKTDQGTKKVDITQILHHITSWLSNNAETRSNHSNGQLSAYC